MNFAFYSCRPEFNFILVVIGSKDKSLPPPEIFHCYMQKMLIAPSSSIKELSDGFNVSLGDQCVHIPAPVPL